MHSLRSAVSVPAVVLSEAASSSLLLRADCRIDRKL